MPQHPHRWNIPFLLINFWKIQWVTFYLLYFCFSQHLCIVFMLLDMNLFWIFVLFYLLNTNIHSNSSTFYIFKTNEQKCFARFVVYTNIQNWSFFSFQNVQKIQLMFATNDFNSCKNLWNTDVLRIFYFLNKFTTFLYLMFFRKRSMKFVHFYVNNF